MWHLVEKTETCWLFTGCLVNGYGQVSVGGGKRKYAHVASFEEHHGPVPEGKQVCHSCDVRNCVRPSHLFVGTALENQQDKVSKGRQARGEKHGLAKLNWSAVAEIRSRYKKGDSENGVRPLAREFGVDPAAVRRIVRNERWAA